MNQTEVTGRQTTTQTRKQSIYLLHEVTGRQITTQTRKQSIYLLHE